MDRSLATDISSHFDDETKMIVRDWCFHKGPLVLVDLSYHIYRFYYAHRHLGVKNSGFFLPTGHVYGVTNMVCSLRMDRLDPYVVLVLDGKDKSRKEINSDYKKGRGDKEFVLGSISKDILTVLSSLDSGVFMSYNPLFEADDTLYSIAVYFNDLLKKKGISKDIYIYTVDKDLYQGVGEHIRVLKGYKNSLSSADFIDERSVLDEFGVMPERLVYYRALVGDSSDNLKGYFRMPKKVASRLARIGLFTEEGLAIPKDREADLTLLESKWASVVNADYKIFYDNYRIMKLKFYPFRTSKLKHSIEESNFLVDRYKLNQYKEYRKILNG